MLLNSVILLNPPVKMLGKGQMERRGWLNGDVSFCFIFLEVLITLVSRSSAYKYCLSGPLIALKLLLRFW